MSLHKLVRLKFFFLVWHHSWHLEKESWFLWHLLLLLLLLVLLTVVVVVVGSSGGVEHVSMVTSSRVLRRMREWKHPK